jgi:hypothetical protein
MMSPVDRAALNAQFAAIAAAVLGPAAAAMDFCGSLDRTVTALAALGMPWEIVLTPEATHEVIVYVKPGDTMFTDTVDTGRAADLAAALVRAAVSAREVSAASGSPDTALSAPPAPTTAVDGPPEVDWGPPRGREIW